MDFSSAIGKNFSEATPTYNQHAPVQKEAAKQLARFASKHIDFQPHTIIDIGCGTGFLTQALDEQFGPSLMLAADTAESMVQYTLENHAQAKRQLLGCVMDGQKPPLLAPPCTLMASSMVFQWFSHLEETLQQLSLSCRGLCFSIPLSHSFAEWRQWCQQQGIKPSLLPLLSSHELTHLCETISPSSHAIEVITLFSPHETPLSFAKSLKLIGAQGHPQGNPSGRLVRSRKATPEFTGVTYQIALVMMNFP